MNLQKKELAIVSLKDTHSPGAWVSETSLDKDTIYQGKDMGIGKIVKRTKTCVKTIKQNMYDSTGREFQ